MTPVVMPQVGENLATGVVVEWMKAENDAVVRGEVLATVESEKAAFEVVAPADGTLLKIIGHAGDEVEVLSIIACIGEPGESLDIAALQQPQTLSPPPSSSSPSSTPVSSSPRLASPSPGPSSGTRSASPISVPQPSDEPALGTGRTYFASPSARRLARELLVDLTQVGGSGPAGRVIRRDILAAALRACGGSVTPASEARTEPTIEPGDRPEPFARLRQVVAQRMSMSAREIPHFFLFADIDVSDAREWQHELVDEGVGLTDMIVAAAAKSLAKFERLNAHVGAGGIVCKAAVHVGLAVAVADGVLVPAISHADRADLVTLAASRQELTSRARRGIVDPDPPSTFTVSNLGSMGVSRFLPLINPPECAILGVGAAEERVVAHKGKATIREMMTVTLACDHRAVDGAYAANFLSHFTQTLEAARQHLTLRKSIQ